MIPTETNAREGLHSLGEREEGPIPSTATVSQCGVMATREKISFQFLSFQFSQ